MFIDFPAIVSQWVALVSLASSLKNDVLSDQHVSSIAKPLAACQAYFQGDCPVCQVKCVGNNGLEDHWGSPC